MDDDFSSGCTVLVVFHIHIQISLVYLCQHIKTLVVLLSKHIVLKKLALGAADSAHGDQIIGVIAGTISWKLRNYGNCST